MDKAEIVFNKLANEIVRGVGSFMTGGVPGYIGYRGKEKGTKAGKGALIAGGVGAGIGATGGMLGALAAGGTAKSKAMLAGAATLVGAASSAGSYGIGRLWGKSPKSPKLEENA